MEEKIVAALDADAKFIKNDDTSTEENYIEHQKIMMQRKLR